jgi:hemerythrin-like domain-containing protein
MIAHHDGRDQDGESDGASRPDPRMAIEAQSVALINTPLEFLLAEHLRQRQAAKILSLIADGLINRRTIAVVICFIEEDLAQHILDEEIAFFPLLRNKCEKEDNIEALLGLLADEHRDDERQSGDVLRVLRSLAGGGEANAEECALLREFADRLRRHIALENGVLLPLARSRLDPVSLDVISQSMRSRRTGRKI